MGLGRETWDSCPSICVVFNPATNASAASRRVAVLDDARTPRLGTVERPGRWLIPVDTSSHRGSVEIEQLDLPEIGRRRLRLQHDVPAVQWCAVDFHRGIEVRHRPPPICGFEYSKHRSIAGHVTNQVVAMNFDFDAHPLVAVEGR